MSNAKPTVNSHFQGHELHETSPAPSGEPEAPVSTTESALPTSKEARDQYALGNWYLEPVQRQYSLAINAYKRALEFDPDCAAVHHSLGFAYYKEGEFDLAQESLQTAIELNPQNANYHYVLGQLLEDWTELEGAWEQAIHEFTRAIELDSSYIEAWYNRGLLYEKRGDLEKACEDFKQVVSRAPSFHAARHNLGVLYIKRHQWEDAERVFEGILEVEPREPDAHYHLAEIYLNLYGDVDQAIHCLQYAIERDPEHLDARFELGLLYAKHRYTRPAFRQQAIDQFIELIKRDDELQTFEPLGQVFFVLGSLYDDRPEDADLAIYAYKTGLEHAPSPQAQNNLGLLYLQKDMIDEAAAEFKQVIQRYPDYESPYHNLAKLYFYERDEEILKDLQAWLEEEPQTAARIIFHLTLSLMDVARAEAYQSLYSQLHRLKNLVSATGGQLRSASRQAEPDSKLHTTLNQILTQHEECYNEMVELLQQLRMEEPVFGLTDINRILDTLLRNLMPILEAKDIECQQIFDTRLPPVQGDSSQLKEAFNNLIINAVDAMEGGGFLQIKTAYLPESSQIQISFIDTGVGIPYEVRDQLYQPGYTLKQHGSGFGLNIVQRTVRDHRGSTELDSEEGHGTTFSIYLPVDLEATPIQTNLQMRPIFYESPHELGFEELV